MSKLHVVIDSTAHAEDNLLKKYPNLHIVPLRIIFGVHEWPETEIPNSELFKLVSGGGHPRTSQPAPGDFLKVYKPILAAGDEIITITIAGGLSGTVRSAAQAAQMAGAKHIHIIDSGTTAIGIVKLAEKAFELAEQGLPAAVIAERLKRMCLATRTMFISDTLEYLHKGGRIGGAAALFGTILQIKPILYLTDGKVTVLDKVRTRSRAIDRMVEELQKYPKIAYIGLVHIETEFEARMLADRLQNIFPETPVSVSEAGSVLGAHLGPGMVGIVFQET